MKKINLLIAVIALVLLGLFANDALAFTDVDCATEEAKCDLNGNYPDPGKQADCIGACEANYYLCEYGVPGGGGAGGGQSRTDWLQACASSNPGDSNARRSCENSSENANRNCTPRR